MTCYTYVAQLQKRGTKTIWTGQWGDSDHVLLKNLISGGDITPGLYIICAPEKTLLHGHTFKVDDGLNIHVGLTLTESPTNITHWPPRRKS